MNEEKKKGLHPLAWIGIGCAVLVVLGGIAVVIGIVVVGNKVKTEIDKFEQQPALTTAEWIARTNPDIEIAGKDETAETVTFRNVKTGEEVTVTFKDLEEGKVSFSTPEGGETNFEVQGTEGSVTVTSDQGQMVLGGTAGDLPAWVPRYAGAELQVTMRATNAQGEFGNAAVRSADAVEKVLDYYQQTLNEQGFNVERTDQTLGEVRMGSVVGRHGDGRFVSVVLTRQEDHCEGALQYGKEAGGSP